MTLSLAQIYDIIAQYQYLILFPIVAIEGPITMVICGFLIAQGLMNFYLAFIIIVVADVSGDILYYALGRWGRKGFLDKWGKYIGLPPDKLAGLENHFKNYSGKTLLVSKFAHGIGTMFLVAAGAAEMPLKKFTLYNFLGTVPKSLMLLFIGYFFGQAVARISRYFDYIALSTFSLAIGLAIGYFAIQKLSKKKEKELKEKDRI